VKVVGKLQIISDYSSISTVEDYIDSLRNEWGINESVYGNMLLAVVEAVTNAIQHGNACDCTKMVTFEVRKNDKYISFLVKDQGEGFDPESVPDPTLPENIEEPCGRGVFLIRHLADAVHFDDNGTTVKMEFALN